MPEVINVFFPDLDAQFDVEAILFEDQEITFEGEPGRQGTPGATGGPGPKGDKGDQGIQGPAGSPGGAVFTFEQMVSSDTWTIPHGLGFNPAITITDTAGTAVYGSVTYPDLNTAVVTFSVPFSGRADLV